METDGLQLYSQVLANGLFSASHVLGHLITVHVFEAHFMLPLYAWGFQAVSYL